jgi:protein-S-isoprenylcysteine O-methyltransferase Ste14
MISCMKRIPRAGLLALTPGAVAMHAALPYQLSRLGGRAGPPARTTPAVRTAGLLTVAAGASLMAWAFAAHYQAAPRGWAVQPLPASDYLVRAGPYRLSRNPIYTGESVVWLGWSLFYGRPAVWAGSAILCAAWPAIVRWEERRLLEQFGDDYRAYLAQVPRWVPRAARR